MNRKINKTIFLVCLLLLVPFVFSTFSVLTPQSPGRLTSLGENLTVALNFTFNTTADDVNTSLWWVNFTAPAGLFIANITPNFTGWACDDTLGDHTQFNCSNTSYSDTLVNTTIEFSFYVWSNSDGNYTLDINSADNNSGTGFDQNYTLVFDAVGPAVSFVTPTSGLRIFGSSYNFTVQAEDNMGVVALNISEGGTYSEFSLVQGTGVSGNWTNMLTLATYGDGNHTFTVNSSNGYLFNDSVTVNVIFDTAGPVISLASPSNNTNTTSSATTFSYTPVDVWASAMNCTFYLFNTTALVYNTTNASALNNTADTVVYTLPADGNYSWNVSCWDNATSTESVVQGNYNQSVTNTFKYDSTAPSITLNNPTSNMSYTFDATPLINVTVNGTGSSVLNVTVELNGSTYYMGNMTCSGSAEMTCYFSPTVNLSDATYQFNVSAWDSANSTGNMMSTLWNLTVDSTGPAVTSASVNTSTLKSTDSILINVTAIDVSTNISNVSVGYTTTVDMGNHTATNYNVTTTPASLGCSGTGWCVLTFNATDYSGASNTTETTSIYIDELGPIVSGASIANATKAKNDTIVNIVVFANDTNVSVSTVTVNNVSMYSFGNGTWYTNTSGSEMNCTVEGNCVLTFNATDSLGNSNTTTTTTFYIDATPPVNTTVFNASAVTSTTATINATLNESSKCTVIYGIVNTSLTSETNSSAFSTSGTVSLSGLSASTVYYYNVTQCWDEAGNNQTLNYGVFNFTTSAAAADNSGTSGGGGSGGGSSASYTAGALDGSIMEYKLGRNDAVNFNHGGEQHRVKVKKVGMNYAEVEISSETIELKLYIGKSQEVDIDGDGVNDIKVELLSILASKAQLKMTSLSEQPRSVLDTIKLLPPAKPNRETQGDATEDVLETVAEPAAEPEVAQTTQTEQPPVDTDVETVEPEGVNWIGLIIVLVILALIVVGGILLVRRRHRQ